MITDSSIADLLAKHRDPKKRITRAEINALALYSYEGPITFINNLETEAKALDRLKNAKAIGFDTETRPSFRKGKTYNPSLIQMATDNEVFLFHIRAYTLSESLSHILADKKVVKAGVAILDDMKELARIRPFKPQGLVDLGNLARKEKISQHGLRGMAALLLGIRISKTEQCSNWGRQVLTEKQVRYAATDAWISLALYRKMLELSLIS